MAPLMVNCKEYSELVSKGLDRQLSLWEKVLVKMHGWVCGPCVHVEKQFTTLADACRHLPSDDEGEQGDASVLPNDACARIKAALKKEHGNSSA